jgi:hypothetical protein
MEAIKRLRRWRDAEDVAAPMLFAHNAMTAHFPGTAVSADLRQTHSFEASILQVQPVSAAMLGITSLMSGLSARPQYQRWQASLR